MAAFFMRLMISCLLGYVSLMITMAIVGSRVTTVDQNIQICVAYIFLWMCYFTYKKTFKD